MSEYLHDKVKQQNTKGEADLRIGKVKNVLNVFKINLLRWELARAVTYIIFNCDDISTS